MIHVLSRLALLLAIAAGPLGCRTADSPPEAVKWNDIHRPWLDNGNNGLERHVTVGDANYVDVVLSDAHIAVSGLQKNEVVFNPSMVEFGEGALVVFRKDDTANDPDMKIGLMALDANFAPVGKPTYLDMRPPNHSLHTAEDPRLVWHKGELYVVINQRLKSETYYPRVIFLARIGELPQPAPFFAAAANFADPADAPSLAGKVTMLKRLVPPAPLPFRPVEKNWAPFSDGRDLKIIYRSNPPLIFSISDAQLAGSLGNVTPDTITDGIGKIPYEWGELRGGTGAFLRASTHCAGLREPAPHDPNTISMLEGQKLARGGARATTLAARGDSAGASSGSAALFEQLTAHAWRPFAQSHAERSDKALPADAKLSLGDWLAANEANGAAASSPNVCGPFGSTAAASDQGACHEPYEYEAFFHTQRPVHRRHRTRNHYVIGYYTFSAEPPYEITSMLPAPLLLPSALEAEQDDTNRMVCSYPGGFIRRGNVYYVIYGHQDTSIRMITLDACALLAHSKAAP